MQRLFSLFALILLVAVWGCSEATESAIGVTANDATPAVFNIAGAPTVQFSVPDMMCPEGCGAKVKEILSKQPGAKDVLVDFPNRTATVAVDRDKFNAKQAVAALVDCQFRHSTLKVSNSATTAAPPSAEAKSIK